MVAIRAAKIAMVAAIALHATLVAFGNVTDYATNFTFVRHVLSMDTIFKDATIGYRAVANPALHHAAYTAIIAVETMVAVLCWIGAFRLLRLLRADAAAFNAGKALAVMGLTLGLLLWQVGFISIAGEWFGMWMSQQWNGVASASRIVASLFGVLIFLVLCDQELSQRTTG
ncbi:MAG: DUF2165 domain-containing protein [Proteobacteria bacterium]|nr:DUF2165 domain-containing protein [Pseudomonadota bacterium]